VVGTVAAVAGLIGLGLWMASMLAALVSLVLRFRSSRGTEHQQLRWVAAGATGTVIGLLLGMAVLVATYFTPGCGSAPRPVRRRPAADPADDRPRPAGGTGPAYRR
jgi:hypothetical protein